MNEKFIKLKIAEVVNKRLYNKKIIEENLYKKATAEINKLIFQESKK